MLERGDFGIYVWGVKVKHVLLCCNLLLRYSRIQDVSGILYGIIYERRYIRGLGSYNHFVAPEMADKRYTAGTVSRKAEILDILWSLKNEREVKCFRLL